ncbi:sensor histidine kinase [Salipaludibacillus sp. CUR1]|uniref:sensor histidine kinase n=1 Tax=Salipaludibacillus sp. CUR1 TaxID=2820003 RepID=UPI001E3B060D|nr:sensor histidine kinase [Salipaludibacillus sp. CUR1]MCE7793488.1 sensor histidine kinase [Salipaludibacillus sp. CUR1]
MSTLIRHILIAVLFLFLFSLFLLGLTFMAFPLESWSRLYQQSIYDVSYLYFVLITIGAAGVVFGLIYGSFWRKKLKNISEGLEDLIKGQKISLKRDGSLTELTEIQKQVKRIEEKMTRQAEISQKLASERAIEREKSLHEVVVQERNRLARELHDSVSQQLFAASMMMSTINETNPPEDQIIKKQLNMVEKMIDQSQLEMRALLLHLRPAALKGKTLTEGIEELLAELKEKVPLSIEAKLEDLTLDKGVEDHLFRILQESISNTLRHARAGLLQVMLIARDDNVILRITDDGQGFNVQEARNHGSYGIQNMYERAEELGGTMKVVSIENEGTRLEVKVPALNKRGESDD